MKSFSSPHPRVLAALCLAGCVLTAQPGAAQPIISEIYYNPPTGTESAFEWVEIYNPGPDSLDLAGIKLISGSTGSPKQGLIPLNTPSLAAGEYAVLSKAADLGAVCRVASVSAVVEGDFGLNNSSAQVALYAADQTNLVEPNALDIVFYAAAGFPASTDGLAIALNDLQADNYLGANWSLVGTSGCQQYATATTGALYGSPGRSNDWCADDAGAAEATCLPPSLDAGQADVGIADAAVIDLSGTDVSPVDAGPLPDIGGIDLDVFDSAVTVLDAGPQHRPSILLSEPSSDQNAGAGVQISYAATDPDGDAISVALFYDDDDQGFEGVLINSALPASGSFTWVVTDVPAGDYYIFGRALDSRGGLAYAYATGRVHVDPPSVENPRLDIVNPSGDDEASESYTISYSTNGVPGSVSLYYDADNIEGAAIPIAGGLAIPGGDEHVAWNVSQVTAGTYYIYGRYETAVGQTSAFSVGTVSVVHDAGGCACQHQGNKPTSVFFLFVLVAFLGFRRGRRAEVVN